MKKNNCFYLFFVLILFVPIQAMVTAEQFNQLSEKQKWQQYEKDIKNYDRIFKAKNRALIELENNATFWKDLVIPAVCISACLSLIAISMIRFAASYPERPSE